MCFFYGDFLARFMFKSNQFIKSFKNLLFLKVLTKKNTMKKSTFLFALMTLIGFSSLAQRSTTAKEADYSFLKGKKEINVVFNYEGMTVGKNKTEETYVNETVAEKNEKKAGTGDEWRQSWEKGKLNVYEPAFSSSFTKRLSKAGIKASAGDNAEITAIVKTTRIEPGYNVGVSKMAAQIDIEITFVETANQDNILAQIVMSRVGGSDGYAVSERVKFAYYNAGSQLGGHAAKALKK